MSFLLDRSCRPFALALLALAIAAPAHAADWTGTEMTIDGALHVKNPEAPSEGAHEVRMKELWRIGGDSEEEGEFFGVTGRILESDDGHVYILDRQLNEIKVFTVDGAYVRTIGREGEGPGEFRNASDMFFVPGGDIGVMQMMPTRIVQLSAAGEPGEDYPATSHEGFRAMHRGELQGDQVVLAEGVTAFNDGKMDRTSYLASYSATGEQLVRYHEGKSVVDFATLEFDETDLDGFLRHWAVGEDGTVICATEWSDYSLTVWNPDGSVKRVIHRDVERQARTDEQKKDAGSRFGININGRDATIVVNDHQRAISNIFPREDGGIWVMPGGNGRDLPDGIFASVDVFDAQGHYVRQLMLRGEGDLEEDALYVGKDRIYVVRGIVAASRGAFGSGGDDDEEESEGEVEPLSIICYRLEG